MDSTNNFSGDQASAPDGGIDREISARFHCPACRAKQPLQNECRRCGADLSLVVAARRRIAFLQERLEQSTEGSSAYNRHFKELQRLLGTTIKNAI